MGDRASVKLNFGSRDDQALPPIYLYSHWGGSDMPATLALALRRGESRWDDDSYLARIIASAVFVDAGITDTTGAGLSPYPIEDVHFEVDLTRQVVIDHRHGGATERSFADFASHYADVRS